MGWRKHQAELEQLFKEIVAGLAQLPRVIGCHVCCGGGKQALAGIFAYYMIHVLKKADRVCWVVPNGTLRKQARQSFGAGKIVAKMLGIQMEVYESINTQNPSKGKTGYVITYHALTADKIAKLNAREFERFRYALILDEPHHIAVGEPLHDAVKPLVERAVCVLLMSGTLDRHDMKRVYLLHYGDDRLPDTTSRPEFRWIRYSITDAIEEQAIILVEFLQIDAQGRWFKDGEEQRAETLGDNADALFTALHTEFAEQLLRSCSEHWRSYRLQHPRSKLLVVCANVKQARIALAVLKKAGIDRADIATYQDEDADQAIERFKFEEPERFRPEDELFALVTVAKAYEGLDVPAITHIACLTHIRSRPWIEQMIARCWRCDTEAGPWNTQRGFVWGPDDAELGSCFGAIELEQQLAIRDRDENDEEPATKETGDGVSEKERPVISPLESMATTERAWQLHGDGMSPALTARYMTIIRRLNLPLTPLQLQQVEENLQEEMVDDRLPTETPVHVEWVDLDAQRRLNGLRTELNVKIADIARKQAGNRADLRGDAQRELNGKIKKLFREREAMEETELKAAIRWLVQTYGG